MERARAAAALLVLAACLACSAAAPVNEQTGLDVYDGGAKDGCYYNFQHYGEGDRIMTNEPCLNCTCHNRMLMCYLRVCPFTKPIGQDCTIEKRGDQCCPVITCPDVHVDLLTSTSTTSPAEYGSSEVGHLEKYGCSIGGKFFSEGSKVPSTPNKPCELCYCIRNMTACVMQECTLHVDGCTPVYHKDVCCPVRYSCDHPEDEILMLDDMTTTVRPTPGFLLTTTTPPGVTQDCVHQDEVFADGALIKTDKACEHCYCMKGDIVCVVQECGTPMENEGKNCTSLPPREGQCCPDTYICEGDTMVEDTTDDNELLTTYLPTHETTPQSEIYHETSAPDISSESALPQEEKGSGLEISTTASSGDVTTEKIKYEPTTSAEGLANITPDVKEPIRPEDEVISKESETSEEDKISTTTEKAADKENEEIPNEETITSIPSLSSEEPPEQSDQVTEKATEELPEVSDNEQISTEHTPVISEETKESIPTTSIPIESPPQKESAPKLDEQPIENIDKHKVDEISTTYPSEAPTEKRKEQPFEHSTENIDTHPTENIEESVTTVQEQFTERVEDQTEKLDESSPEPLDGQHTKNPDEKTTEKVNEPLTTQLYEHFTSKDDEQFTEKPNEQFTEVPKEQSTEISNVESTDRPVEQLDEQSTEKLEQQTERVDQQPTEESIRKSTENDLSTEKPYLQTDVTDKPNEQSTKVIEEQFTEKLDEQSTEKLYGQSTEKLDEQSTEKLDEQSTEKLDEKSTEKHEQPTEQLDEQSTEKLHVQSTEKYNEPSTEKPYEQSTEKLDEKPTEKYGESTEKLDEQSTEKLHEQSTERLDEQSIEKLHELSTEKLDEQSTEKHEEQSTDKLYEKSTEKYDEQSTETHDERFTEKHNEESTEKLHEQSTEKLEQSTEKVDDLSTKNSDVQPTQVFDQQPTEQMIEMATEKVYEISTGKPYEQTDEKPTGKPNEQPTDKLDDQSTEGLDEKSTEKLAEASTEKLEESVTVKLDEQYTQKTDDLSTNILIEPTTDKYGDHTTEKHQEQITEKFEHPSTGEITEKYDELITDKFDEFKSKPEQKQPITESSGEEKSTTAATLLPSQIGTEYTSQDIPSTAEPLEEGSGVSSISQSTESLEEEKPTSATTTIDESPLDTPHITSATEKSSDVSVESTSKEATEDTLFTTLTPITQSKEQSPDSTFTTESLTKEKSPDFEQKETTAFSSDSEHTTKQSTTSDIPKYETSTDKVIESDDIKTNSPSIITTSKYSEVESEPHSTTEDTKHEAEGTLTPFGVEETTHHGPSMSEASTDVNYSPSSPYDLPLDEKTEIPVETSTEIKETTSIQSVSEPAIVIVGPKDTVDYDKSTQAEDKYEPSSEAPVVPVTTELISESPAEPSKEPNVDEITDFTQDKNVTPEISPASDNKEIDSLSSSVATTELPTEPIVISETLGLSTTTDSPKIELVTDAIVTTEENIVTSVPDLSENEIDEEENGMGHILPHIPGEGDCLVDGKTYTNDSMIPSTNKCQSLCRCVSSIVKCDPIQCSPPPENMINCKPMYDAKESCCPTYICDTAKETIAPESHNQMLDLTTELPTSEKEITIPNKPLVPETSNKPECNSGDCQVNEEVIIPVHVADSCSSEGCAPISGQSSIPNRASDEIVPSDCKSGECTPASEVNKCQSGGCESQESSPSQNGNENVDVPIIPVAIGTPEECTEDSCTSRDSNEGSKTPGSPTGEYGTELPVVSCSGEDCDKSSTSMSPDLPTEECKTEDCIKPVPTIPNKQTIDTMPSDPMISGAITTESTPEITSCNGGQCEISPIVVSTSEECKGIDCESQKPIPADVLPSDSTPCTGDQCDVPKIAISETSSNEECNNGKCGIDSISPEMPSSKPCAGDQCDVQTALMPEDSLTEECKNGDCGIGPISSDTSSTCVGDQCGIPTAMIPESSSQECDGDCVPGTVLSEIPASAPCLGEKCDTPTTATPAFSSDEECKSADCTAGSMSPEMPSGVPCTGDKCDIPQISESNIDVPESDSSALCKSGDCEKPVSVTPKAPASVNVPCDGEQCNIPVVISPDTSEACKSGACENPISEITDIEAPLGNSCIGDLCSVPPTAASNGSSSDRCTDGECQKPNIAAPETQKPSDVSCNGNECDVSIVTQEEDTAITTATETETTQKAPISSMQPITEEQQKEELDQSTTETSITDSQKTTLGDTQTTKLHYELTTLATEQKEPEIQGSVDLPNEIDDSNLPTESYDTTESKTSFPLIDSKFTTTQSEPMHVIDEATTYKPTNEKDEALNEIPSDSNNDKFDEASTLAEYLPTESSHVDDKSTAKADEEFEESKTTTSQSVLILSEVTSTERPNIGEVHTDKTSIEDDRKPTEVNVEIPVTEEAISSEKESTASNIDIETTIQPIPEEPTFVDASTQKSEYDITTFTPEIKQSTEAQNIDDVQHVPSDAGSDSNTINPDVLSSTVQSLTTLQETTTAYYVELDQHTHVLLDQEITGSEKPEIQTPDIQEGSGLTSITMDESEMTTASVLKEKETPVVESHTLDTEMPETNVQPEVPALATVAGNSVTEEPLLVTSLRDELTTLEATTPKIISSTAIITEKEGTTEITADHSSEQPKAPETEQSTEEPIVMTSTKIKEKETETPSATESYPNKEEEREKQTMQPTIKPNMDSTTEAEIAGTELQTNAPSVITSAPEFPTSISDSEPERQTTDIPKYEYTTETLDEQPHDDLEKQTTVSNIPYIPDAETETSKTPDKIEITDISKETTLQSEQVTEFPEKSEVSSTSLPLEDENILVQTSASPEGNLEGLTSVTDKEINVSALDETKPQDSNEIEPEGPENVKPDSPASEGEYITTNQPEISTEKEIYLTVKPQDPNAPTVETGTTETSEKTTLEESLLTELPHVSEEHEHATETVAVATQESSQPETESSYSKSTEVIPTLSPHSTEPSDIIASEETTAKPDRDSSKNEIPEREPVTILPDEGEPELSTILPRVTADIVSEPTTEYIKPLSTEIVYSEPSTPASGTYDITPKEEEGSDSTTSKPDLYTSVEEEISSETKPETPKTPISAEDQVHIEVSTAVPQDLGTEQYEGASVTETLITDKPTINEDKHIIQQMPESPATIQPESSIQPLATTEHTVADGSIPYEPTTQRADEELPKTTSTAQSTELYEPPSSAPPAVEQAVTEESANVQPESDQETIQPDVLDKETATIGEPIPTISVTNAPTEVPVTPEETAATPTTPIDDSVHEQGSFTSSEDNKSTAQPTIAEVKPGVQDTEKPELPSDEKMQSAPVPTEQEEHKPTVSDELPSASAGSGDLPSPGEDVDHQSPDRFPSPGYGGEPDYEEEDQAFGPGTCRYGGKVYVSAQQIPRDDPCDFCFCFRSDIICLQQSCPPPIHGCHEEPINGFCCPRYECPVSMATTLNVTTTTTTTTTTLPPHFLPHAYKGAAQRRGCHIKGHSYQVGEVVRASSGPCLHCTCGGDGQMKCDPKVCTPEPMLRQMIAAAVSTKRRR